MSPLWGFGYLVHAVCYKHAAPLGLKAPTHQNSRHGIHRRGLVSKPSGLGEPNPYGFDRALVSRYFNPCPPPNPPNPRFRPMGHVALWGFGIFVCPVCYIHAAPLGLKAPVHQNSRHGIHRRGEVSKPDGLGNPTPTHPISLPAFNPVHPLILSILI